MTTSALTDANARRLYEEELLVGEAMENVAALLQSLGISQRELASRLGVTEARVSQVTRGGKNLTLRSLAAIGWALGVRFDIAPIALSSAERRGTPSEGDPEPPAWLGRMRTRPALQQDEARRSAAAVTSHGHPVT
jgi:transcriptional regulator with XRE-family HTH domain